MTRGTIKIGTSGFSYDDWLGNFYPQFCPKADYLQYFASQFKTVEIDSTFYRIPSEKMVDRWNQVTPAGFVFAAKFPRTVTHEGDLEARLDAAGRFVEVMRGLGDKLGPLLLQFPYGFRPDERELLLGILEVLPQDLRYAVELRNKTWLKDADLFERFRRGNIAYCLIDHPWMPRTRISTADFRYVRLLGDRKKIGGDFSFVRDEREDDLAWWQELLEESYREGQQVYLYVNNHFTGHSPSTARSLIDRLGRSLCK